MLPGVLPLLLLLLVLVLVLLVLVLLLPPPPILLLLLLLLLLHCPPAPCPTESSLCSHAACHTALTSARLLQPSFSSTCASPPCVRARGMGAHD